MDLQLENQNLQNDINDTVNGILVSLHSRIEKLEYQLEVKDEQIKYLRDEIQDIKTR